MLTEKDLESLAPGKERDAARAFAAAFDHLPPSRAMDFIKYMRGVWAQQHRRAFHVVK